MSATTQHRTEADMGWCDEHDLPVELGMLNCRRGDTDRWWSTNRGGHFMGYDCQVVRGHFVRCLHSAMETCGLDRPFVKRTETWATRWPYPHRLVCWLRGHDWVSPVIAGIDKGRACARCWYSDQLLAHVFQAEDGSIIWGRFEGSRRWVWPA